MTMELPSCQNCRTPDDLVDIAGRDINLNGPIAVLEMWNSVTGFKLEKEILPKLCQLCLTQITVAYCFKNGYEPAQIPTNPLPTIQKTETSSDYDMMLESSNRKDVKTEREEGSLENSYECHNCCAQFAKKSECMRHIKRKHMYSSSNRKKPVEKKLLCVHCGRSFSFPSDLEIHLKTHSEERAYSCDAADCSSAFKTKYALERHRRRHIKLKYDGEFSCQSCNLHFSKQIVLDTHRISHSEKTRCGCLRCGEDFNCLIGIQKHLVEKHKNDTDRYRPVLDGAPEKIFKCLQCDMVYAIFFSLRQHIIGEHYSEKNSFQCEKCSKFYRTKFMLVQHQHQHSTVLPFQCAEENCTYRTNNKQNFKGHLLRLHDVEYDEVLHGYDSERSLEISKRHKELLKSGFVRPYLSKKALQKKIVTTNPWKCKQCPRTFSHSGNLARHIKVEHNHQMFECKFCDRKFSGQAGLWIHSFSHKGIKPFNCPSTSCEYRTTHKLNFKNHLKKYHDIIFAEEVHGYKETMKEVMNYVLKRNDQKTST